MNAFLGPQFVRTHCGRAPPPQLVIGVRVIGLEPGPTHTAAHCSPLTRETDTRTLDHGSDTADTPPAPARPRRRNSNYAIFPPCSLLLTSQFPGPSVRGDQTPDGGLNLEHRQISDLNKVGLQNVITLSERAGLGWAGLGWAGMWWQHINIRSALLQCCHQPTLSDLDLAITEYLLN